MHRKCDLPYADGTVTITTNLGPVQGDVAQVDEGLQPILPRNTHYEEKQKRRRDVGSVCLAYLDHLLDSSVSYVSYVNGSIRCVLSLCDG